MSSRRERLRGRRLRVVASLLLVTAVASCTSSSDGGAGGAAPKPDAARASTTTTTTFEPPHAAPDPSDPAGDAFYRVPDPLPKGSPGEIIRLEAVKGGDAGTSSYRLMYHSRDATGRDRAVTGTVTFPTGDAPKGGWPVVAWAHGTTGLTSICAPSRHQEQAPGFGIEGVRVATDYIGLGPIGERHSYLDGPAEAHAVIDSVRAARTIAEAHAGKDWVAVGHSQGGHSALWTNQLGQAYAPELHLLGTVAVAPAAMLTETYGPSDQVVPRMVGVMALYGAAADHPEVDPHDFVGPLVRKAEGVVDTGCLNDVVNAFVGIPAATFYAHDPLTTEPTRTLVRASDTGKVAVDAPLLVIYGTADPEVIPARVHALYDRLCKVGQVTGLLRVDGATHDSVVPKAGSAITQWLQDRIGAKAVHDACEDGWS